MTKRQTRTRVAGAALRLESLAFLTFFFQSGVSGGPIASPHPPFLALVTACERIGGPELSSWDLVFINLYSAAPRAGRSFVSGRRRRSSGASAGSASPSARPTPGTGTCCARSAEGAEAPTELPTAPAPPLSAGRRRSTGSSSGRRQLPAEEARRRGDCGQWRPLGAARRPHARRCSGALPEWRQRAPRPLAPAPTPRLASRLARPPAPLCVREGDAAGDERIAGELAARGPREAVSRCFSPSRRPALGFEIMYVRAAGQGLLPILATRGPSHFLFRGRIRTLTALPFSPRPLSGDTFHQDNRPSGLIRTYLGRSPLVSGDESTLLLNAANTVARPVFTEYQATGCPRLSRLGKELQLLRAGAEGAFFPSSPFCSLP
ncbi:hypothetical protein P7K49_005013 [Saguinus oedipus]|uniref:Uncharacterized protein n=1 Tax=Saguinus oedipus TaxID=9490 RepID=A0ABQ9W931_SAGOE|nr:hypothetical protein P7K49_005013 [Saguinus oedipus]